MSDDKINLLRSFIRHREFVAAALERVAFDLRERARVHDLSKLLDDEFEGFARINAVARINKFGSPEYDESTKREQAVINLHFSRNSHHPEHQELSAQKAGGEELLAFGSGLPTKHDMTFLDVIEMVCDWYGARLGYDDSSSWGESVELNLEHKAPSLTKKQLWLARQVADFLGSKETR